MKNKLITLLAAIAFWFTANAQETPKKIEEIQIKTSAICNMCKERLEGDLAFEKGIKSAKLDVKTKILTVKYNTEKTSPEAIKKAVSKIGYDADEVLADEKAYGKLPKCCKKDGMPD